MIEQLRKRLLDRETPVRIHLIGVAGAGMSGLARMLLEMGHRVSGCDRVTSDETERLQQAGLVFSCPHSAAAVSDAEVVIYSSAIREENVALAAARQNGCLCLRRAECLAAILNNKKGVVVAGTHGKTTTSAMSAHLLREGRMRPCHYVGAEIPVLGANAHWTEDSEYLVAEGDES
ncbi:MAG: UDP-N-acetylenolpyruvoylglucosamine reductase, partial [Akkermansia sp.]|nr:UDP-N-acetylenolpyruvoylglucosamine reductase [Akkermansia sp.]